MERPRTGHRSLRDARLGGDAALCTAAGTLRAHLLDHGHGIDGHVCEEVRLSAKDL